MDILFKAVAELHSHRTRSGIRRSEQLSIRPGDGHRPVSYRPQNLTPRLTRAPGHIRDLFAQLQARVRGYEADRFF
jgi:hypothetical protein